MYVLSVCTALHIAAPTSDIALTLTSYSVPAASLGTMVEFWGGEPATMCWLPQEVFPCILYWRMYLEMGSSLCGMAQVARKAGKPDNTALDRDQPVIWEGTPRMDKRNYLKFHYHRDNTCSTVVYSNTRNTGRMACTLYYKTLLPNPWRIYTIQSFCWVEDFHIKNGIILMTYYGNYIRHRSLVFHRTKCQQVHLCILLLGTSVHRSFSSPSPLGLSVGLKFA